MTAAPRALRASVLVALVLAAVWMFWPTRLGGDTVYVTTHGISMEPRFHTGDLAILRAAGHYSVGDVVAYSSVTLKTTVMHRIVAMDGDRFVFKGDNNSWLDTDHPSRDQLLGALWLRVPRGGQALAMLQQPLAPLLMSFAGTVVLAATSRPLRRAGRRRRPLSRATRAHSLPARALARQAVLVSVGVALAAAAGGAVLLTLPDTQADSQTVPVIQAGQFDYAGTAVRGTTYPTGLVHTGDPVYTQLAKSITVSFRDRVTGSGLTSLRGTLRLVVTIRTTDGWTGTLTSGTTTSLTDGTLAATVLLDPAYATDVMKRHSTEVGASGGSAILTVTPKITLDGAVRGHPFAAASPAGVSFALSGTALLPAATGTTAFTTPQVVTGVVIESRVPRSFQLLSVGVPIGLARILDGVVLALSLVVLAVAAWIGRKRSGDAVDDILLRSAARILPVTQFTPGSSVVDVSDADALRRVAERLDSLVLHQVGADGHTFAVQDVETTYRYVLPNQPKPQPPAPTTRRMPRVPSTVLRPVPEDAPSAKHAAPTWPPPVPPRRATNFPPLPARPRPRSRSGGDIGDLGVVFG